MEDPMMNDPEMNANDDAEAMNGADDNKKMESEASSTKSTKLVNEVE